jgi:hypothetical protein
VCETLFKPVWEGGQDAADALRLQRLTAQISPARDPNGEQVRDKLKAHTETAIAQGVFGVPSYAVDGKVLWGLDALPMLRACVEGESWFAEGHWDKAAALPTGLPARK